MWEDNDKVTSTGATSYIRCPYFRAHGAHEVQCEGPIEESRYIVRFKRETDKKLHERIFCKDRYYNCEVCRMNDEKHDDMDGV